MKPADYSSVPLSLDCREVLKLISNPMLAIRNNHATFYSDPPIVSAKAASTHIGFFENRFGEQYIFTWYREINVAILRDGNISVEHCPCDHRRNCRGSDSQRRRMIVVASLLECLRRTTCMKQIQIRQRDSSMAAAKTCQYRSKPETFDLLGFTHCCSRSRRGLRIVKCKTMSSRLTSSVQVIDSWCKAHRHDRLIDQHAALCRKIRGHDATME